MTDPNEDLEERLRRLAEQAEDQPTEEPEPEPEKDKPEEPFDVSKYLQDHPPIIPTKGPLDDLEWDPVQMRFIPKKKYPFPAISPLLNLDHKPDEYEEEKVEVIKGPVSVSIVYRKYSRKYGQIVVGAPDEIIYVTIDGKEKAVYRYERLPYPTRGPAKAIDHIVLSPDMKRLAFDISKEVFSLSTYSMFSSPSIGSLCVVDIDGDNVSEITANNLPFGLPKSAVDEEKDERERKDPLYYVQLMQKMQETKSFRPSERSIYSPKWVGNNTLEFRGRLHYQSTFFSSILNSTHKPTPQWTTGPECLIRATLDEQNKIKHAKLVERL